MKIYEIEKVIYSYLKKSGYWWILPKMHYFAWEADIIAWGPQKGILEVEIKTSWADYKKDYDKKTWDCLKTLDKEPRHMYKDWEKELAKFKTRHGADTEPPDWKRIKIHPVSKYDWLLGSYEVSWRPTYFMYAAPMELAIKIGDDPDRKNPFGVIGVDKDKITSIRSTQRLMKMRPWYMSSFRSSIFKRAMWFMDTYYEYTIPTITKLEGESSDEAITI